MKHILPFAGLLLLVTGFLAIQKVRAQYPVPIPVPFIGFTVATTDPVHCTVGLSPLNLRTDLNPVQYHMCTSTDTWSTLLNSAQASPPYTTFWVGGISPTVATSGTDTTGIANQQWIAPVYIPANQTITGISYLIATGGTDRAIAALYSNAGVLLANSTTASAGTVVGSSSTMQSLAFTAPYAAAGPANYWVSIQTNGTTAHIRTAPVGAFFTAVQAAGGTAPLATITVPTSFTTAQAPIASTY